MNRKVSMYKYGLINKIITKQSTLVCTPICLMLLLIFVLNSTAFAQGIRKDYTEMTDDERDALMDAYWKLGNDQNRNGPIGGLIDQIGNFHDGHFRLETCNCPDPIHFNSITLDVFLAWHRQSSVELQRAMKNEESNEWITIPYWDWTVSNSKSDALWGNDWIGQFNIPWELGRSNDNGQIAPTQSDIDNILNISTFFQFSNSLENSPLHFWGHVWTDGLMTSGESPKDPAFFFHHNMVDKIWAEWYNMYGDCPGSSGCYIKTDMPRYDGTETNILGDDLPLVNPNDIVDPRSLGIFYSDRINGITTLDKYTVSNINTASEKFGYQYRIEAKDDFLVPSGKNAELRSSKEISLLPGFHAHNGSSFIAKIDEDENISTVAAWEDPMSTDQSGLFRGQAQINGVSAEEDDWIAAFDSNGNLAGSFQLTIDNDGAANIEMPVYGDDSTSSTDEGMNVGEYFTLQIFDASEDAYYYYTIDGSIAEFTEWENTNGSAMEAYGDTSDVYNFLSAQTCSQTINLNAGWNLISFNNSPVSNTVTSVFAGLQPDNLEFVTGFDGGAYVYDPNLPPPFNTLQTIDDGFGYWVKVINADVLTAIGSCVDDGLINPLDAGWNLIAYPPLTPQSPSVYFADLIAAGNLEFVTGFDGGTSTFDPVLPGPFNTLQQLENGFGYWVKVINPAAKTANTLTNVFSFIYGKSNLPIGEQVKVLNETGETIAIADVVEDGYLMTTPIYGDDKTTVKKEYVNIGENLRFSWNNQIVDSKTTFKGDYGVEKIDLEFKLLNSNNSEIQDSSTEFKLYPNPTKGQFLIESNALAGTQELSINIFGLDGTLHQTIKKNTVNNINIDISDLPNGVYMVQLVGQDFTATKKLIKH